MSIKELIKRGSKILSKNNVENPIQICRIMLAAFIKKPKEYLIIHLQEQVHKDVEKKYIEGVSNIANGYPLQYITNYQEFMKLNFFVDESVLIPRQDTEILVEEVLNILKNREECKVLDLCTGSGAIGISIAKYHPKAKVSLSDISKEALEIAKKNAILNEVDVKIFESDLFKKIKDDKFDVIVSNPPYIETEVIKTLDKQVRCEPILALDGGKDGLDIYRRIIKEAHKHLNNDGVLALEIGYNQKEKVVKLLEEEKVYNNIYSKQDLAKNDRIIVCKLR